MTVIVKRLALCLLLALACCAPLMAQEAPAPQRDAEKEKAIRELLEITGTTKVAMQTIDQMMLSLRQSPQSIPQEFFTEFRKKLKAEDLVDIIVPIYDKHYTKEDIDGLIAFYKTPLGQKVTATLPLISQESAAAGERWGQEKAMEVLQEMEKRRGAQPKPGRAAPPQSRSKPAKGKGR